MSVKFVPHYKHFSNLMRVLTLFVLVLEFLIGFRKSSGLLMHKICDFRNAELTSRISTISEKQIFPRVLRRFSIVLKFLTLLEIVPVNYGKYSYSKFPPIFSKSHF